MMHAKEYASKLSFGHRVLFTGMDHHPKTGHYCNIVGVLPNPSGRAENQWYDVRFEDHSLGRCLMPADTNAGEVLRESPTDAGTEAGARLADVEDGFGG
jgi:hypothetical protein